MYAPIVGGCDGHSGIQRDVKQSAVVGVGDCADNKEGADLRAAVRGADVEDRAGNAERRSGALADLDDRAFRSRRRNEVGGLTVHRVNAGADGALAVHRGKLDNHQQVVRVDGEDAVERRTPVLRVGVEGTHCDALCGHTDRRNEAGFVRAADVDGLGSAVPAPFDALLIVDVSAAGLVSDVEIAVFGRADSLVPRLAPELRRVNPHTVDVSVREVRVALPRLHSAGDGLTGRKCAVGVNVDVAEFSATPRVNLVERVVVVRVHASAMAEVRDRGGDVSRVVESRHCRVGLIPAGGVVPGAIYSRSCIFVNRSTCDEIAAVLRNCGIDSRNITHDRQALVKLRFRACKAAVLR